MKALLAMRFRGLKSRGHKINSWPSRGVQLLFKNSRMSLPFGVVWRVRLGSL